MSIFSSISNAITSTANAIPTVVNSTVVTAVASLGAVENAAHAATAGTRIMRTWAESHAEAYEDAIQLQSMQDVTLAEAKLARLLTDQRSQLESQRNAHPKWAQIHDEVLAEIKARRKLKAVA